MMRAEWTKLRSLPGLAWCLLAVAAAIVGPALLISSGSPGTYDETGYVDEFRFVHRPLTGDGTLVARVRSQDAGHPWAMAGIMLRTRPEPGAPYAAVFVTPGHGVRMQANFAEAGADAGAGGAPRYLRLTRSGDRVAGHASADGVAWSRIGEVRLAGPAGLPATAEAGLFVTSPGLTRMHPMRPALAQTRPSTAVFDDVRLEPAAAQPDAPWAGDDVGARRPQPGPAEPDAAGGFTVTGSGDIIRRADDGSRIVAATAGTLFAALPAIALGALVMTSEYRWGGIRLALAAAPRRGRLLAAKAVVTGAATFATALAAMLGALLLTQPLLRRSGYRPPVYPDPSPLDPATLRVVAGTAAFLALLALLALGAGAVLRRGAGAIALVGGAVLVPVVVLPLLPAGAATWVQRLGPLAGMSAQQVRDTDDTLLLPWAGRPWTGLLVLSVYTAAALGAGLWQLRRRDA
jgi:hypothetical protein